MAVAIVATAGAANANSYLTLADADALVDAMVLSDDVQHWGQVTPIQEIERLQRRRNVLTVSGF